MNAVSQISSELSAALALDLAAGMWPEGQVFHNHNIDPVYGAALLQQDWFRKMVDDAKREWSAISNAKQRIRLKSQIAVEQGLADLYAIVADATTPATARVAAFKELKEVAGVVIREQESVGGASMPTVNIYLNDGDGPSFSVSTITRQVEDDDAPDILDVTPSNPEDDFVGMAPL